jgi:phage-related protein
VKDVEFLGDSLDRIREFPARARHYTGVELLRVQFGGEPTDWKPMKAIGPGVREIRVRDDTGIFRTIYLASRPEAIYVLHAFQKKTQATAKKDIELAARRLREI